MVLKRIFFAFFILAPFSFFGCVQGPSGNWGHMMGYGYGGGFMWIIFLIVIGILIYFLLQASKSKGSPGSTTEAPLDILKKRYARGEITKEEFDRMKADIEG
jgi:putative membrane protein